MLNLRLVFCDRKVMSPSHENSLFAKSKVKVTYDKRSSPNPCKVGSLVHHKHLLHCESCQANPTELFLCVCANLVVDAQEAGPDENLTLISIRPNILFLIYKSGIFYY